MSFLSIQYLFLVLFSKLATDLPLGEMARSVTLLSLSLLFAKSHLNLDAFTALLAFSGFSYFLIRHGYFRLGPIFIIGIYLYFKGYLPWTKSSFAGFAGLSYVLFRILQLSFQVSGGVRKVPAFLEYLLYLFFFPSFLSGPVQDISRFRTRTRSTWVKGVERASVGFLKFYLIGEWFSKGTKAIESRAFLSNYFTQDISLNVIPDFLLSLLSYFFHLYLNFSGYMDIVIGTALILGTSLPENFNAPLKSKDFIDLWQRWHITVSLWFKDNVFSPLLKNVASIQPFRRRKKLHAYLAVPCIFISFLLMGLWHGSGKKFIVYAVLLATLGSLSQFLRLQNRKATSYLGELFSRTFTLASLSFCLFFIRYDDPLVFGFFRNIETQYLALAIGALFGSWGVILFLNDQLEKQLESAGRWIETVIFFQTHAKFFKLVMTTIALIFVVIFAVAQDLSRPVPMIYGMF